MSGSTPSNPLPIEFLVRQFLSLLLLSFYILPRSAFPQPTPATPPLMAASGSDPVPVLPDPALRSNFNPLCDSNLVPCLEIDDFAGHAYAHLQILTQTEHRETAAVVPFGVTLGLFGRFAGGISMQYAFWKAGDASYQQFAPLRLSVTARLLPIFPLWSSGGSSQRQEGDAAHYAPPSGFRLGLNYEHEVRVWKFDGANSLGLLTDMATLRLVGSKMIGPFQLSASLGALYDWRGQFASGEASAQLGLYLPFFRALKVYAEALGRGFPAYTKTGVLLPGLDGQDPLHPHGSMGLGLSFHPHARLDFGVSVQRGFGGLAPWAIAVNFLTLSVGKTYERRAATPVAQLAADVAAEAATRLKKYVDNLPVDPKLDENCLILDKDNVTVLGRFGKPTKNGYYCEQDGFRVPIGHELNRDKKNTKLCRDDALRDCLLERNGREWVPVHRPRLDGACRMTDSDGLVLGQLGTPTADGKACRYEGAKDNGRYGKYAVPQEQRIGEPFYTDADRTAVCLDAEMRRCFMRPPQGRHSLAWGNDERVATALVDGFGGDLSEQADGVKRIAQAAQSVATGKVKMTTVAQEVRHAAADAASSAVGLITETDKQKAAVNAARGMVARLGKAVGDFEKKSPEEKMEAVARETGRLASQAMVNTAVNTVVPGGGALSGTTTKAIEYATAKGAEQMALREAEKAAEKKAAQAAERAAAEEAKRAALETEARNRASFERYKDELRAHMGPPHVNDPELKELMANVYRQNATIGSGSTAAAVRLEQQTGASIKGKFHSQKAADRSKQLERWLRDHPTASPGDRAAAENVLRDMQNALGGN